MAAQMDLHILFQLVLRSPGIYALPPPVHSPTWTRWELIFRHLIQRTPWLKLLSNMIQEWTLHPCKKDARKKNFAPFLVLKFYSEERLVGVNKIILWHSCGHFPAVIIPSTVNLPILRGWGIVMRVKCIITHITYYAIHNLNILITFAGLPSLSNKPRTSNVHCVITSSSR